MTAPHLTTGRWAEAAAADYLQSQGLRLRQRNFRCRLGEIDLVMADADRLVFVEVRFRRDAQYGAGYETVGAQKQRKLLAAANAYLARYRLAEMICRFDVVSVTKRNCRPEFFWVRDAFGQDL